MADAYIVDGPDVDPNPHAKPKIDPVEAAKEMRGLIRDLLDSIDDESESSMYGQYAIDELNSASIYLQRALNPLEVSAFTEAIKARRAKEAKVRFEAIVNQLRNIENNVNRARNHIAAIASAQPPNYLNKTLNRLHVLVQTIPTVHDAPTNLADNQLRAIATLLKNSGYLEG